MNLVATRRILADDEIILAYGGRYRSVLAAKARLARNETLAREVQAVSEAEPLHPRVRQLKVRRVTETARPKKLPVRVTCGKCHRSFVLTKFGRHKTLCRHK